MNAVIGPTAGMVINLSTRSTNSESRSRVGTRALHRFAAKSQQRAQPFIEVWIRGQQFAKIAGLVQPLLVVTHSGFHQQRWS